MWLKAQGHKPVMKIATDSFFILFLLDSILLQLHHSPCLAAAPSHVSGNNAHIANYITQSYPRWSNTNANTANCMTQHCTMGPVVFILWDLLQHNPVGFGWNAGGIWRVMRPPVRWWYIRLEVLVPLWCVSALSEECLLTNRMWSELTVI